MRPPIEPFEIEWNRLSVRQWDALLAACRRPSLPQTWQYAMAMAGTEGYTADMGLIRFDGRPVGAVLVQVRRLLRVFADCRLIRGPLWIHEAIPGEMQKLVLSLLRSRYGRIGTKIQFHPELEDTPDHRRQLDACGFRRVSEGYRTIWLDLAPSLEQLRRDLRRDWRNKLVQAERSGAEVCESIDRLDAFLETYGADKAARGYAGPSPAMIRLMHRCDTERGDATRPPEARLCHLLTAIRSGETVAGVLVTRHGEAATYLAGWNGPAGRAARAHQLLLWAAVRRLRAAGVRWLDLGGTEFAGGGIARFKSGLGGRAVQLVGGYV